MLERAWEFNNGFFSSLLHNCDWHAIIMDEEQSMRCNFAVVFLVVQITSYGGGHLQTKHIMNLLPPLDFIASFLGHLIGH